MLHHITGNISVDKIPFNRVDIKRSARKHNENICMIKPVVKKYTPGGAGIIFHQMVMFTMDIANVTSKKPLSGLCSRIKRRKKMGESQAA
jgi:hypothetical protein